MTLRTPRLPSERTGKPIDPRKVSSTVWGYIVHWPRDGNCPPPEIGYGGRRRRPPKDYKPRLKADYECLPETTEALIHIAMIRLMVRRLAPQ